ncbi:MAG: hypothetical protein LBF37_03435 [Rickettsiales bacterium]|jgi:hypothetical protein|nr:hypothetical protein [Rickettsiales bacterium]
MSQNQQTPSLDYIPDDVWQTANFGNGSPVPSVQQLNKLFAEDPYHIDNDAFFAGKDLNRYPSPDDWADLFMPDDEEEYFLDIVRNAPTSNQWVYLFEPDPYEEERMREDQEAQSMACALAANRITDKECFINNRDVLRGKNLAPLFENKYYMHTCRVTPIPPNYIVLFRNADDGKKYFINDLDNFQTAHPYDSTVAYQHFDEEYRTTIKDKEFFYNGENILAGLNLRPWWGDPETGEIISYFKFTGETLLYKLGYQRYNLLKSEDFKIPRACPIEIDLSYGNKKIKEKGVWRLEYNPKKMFKVSNIMSDHGTFLNLVSYPAQYEKDIKYINIKKSVFRILRDIVAKTCNSDEICYRMIMCIFKSRADEIKKILDTPPKILYTKNKPYRKLKKQPEAYAPSKDVFPIIGSLGKILNDGKRPEPKFYDCKLCSSESVCLYKEVMMDMRAEIEKKEEQERLQQYIKTNNGQGYLFPEILVEIRGKIK